MQRRKTFEEILGSVMLDVIRAQEEASSLAKGNAERDAVIDAAVTSINNVAARISGLVDSDKRITKGDLVDVLRLIDHYLENLAARRKQARSYD